MNLMWEEMKEREHLDIPHRNKEGYDVSFLKEKVLEQGCLLLDSPDIYR